MPLARPSLPCFNECTVDPHYHSLSRFGDNTGVIDFPPDLFFNAVCRQRAFGCMSWHNLDRRFPATVPPIALRPTVRKLRYEFGLQMPEFGTYPLGQQFRYRRGNESFTTMTAAIKTRSVHSEPPKHRIETPTPIIL
jgi:hypothetical protein